MERLTADVLKFGKEYLTQSPCRALEVPQSAACPGDMCGKFVSPGLGTTSLQTHICIHHAMDTPLQRAHISGQIHLQTFNISGPIWCGDRHPKAELYPGLVATLHNMFGTHPSNCPNSGKGFTLDSFIVCKTEVCFVKTYKK